MLCTFGAGRSFAENVSFARVKVIFQERCLDCHSAPDPEGKFLMENYAALLKGGETGPAIVPGQSSESLLVKMIEGRVEVDGKRKIMPPGKRAKLTAEEIAAVRAWIDDGARAPAGDVSLAKEVAAPRITPRVPPRRSIFSLAYEAKGGLLAAGRAGEVEIYRAESQTVLRTAAAPDGPVNALAFSPDGKFLFGGGGLAGLSGDVRQWKIEDGSTVRSFKADPDSIYALAVSPDGRLLATGSYDQKIKLWNAETGEEIRTLLGHNGCVYALAFRPDGKILASASGDRTIKLWDVASGARRETFSQPLKEQLTVAFSPDGKRLAAAGGDNRIRVWEISEEARETTNPLLFSTFAHEGSILRLAFSADGKTLVSAADDRLVKLWDLQTMTERRVLEAQPDWAPGVAFTADKGLAVGRLDGSLAFYDRETGGVLPRPRPSIARVAPRGVQRGTTAQLTLVGKNLSSVDILRLSDPRLKARLLPETTAIDGERRIELTVDASLARGAYELRAAVGQEESSPVKIFVDDLPQQERKPELQFLDPLPVAVWGTHERSGEKHSYEFQAEAGQTLVFDAAAKALGSKAELVLTLSDSAGRVLASNSRFDRTGDPLLGFEFTTRGRYLLTVSELVLAGSPEHFYRLAIGSFTFVTGFYPPKIAIGEESEVTLSGFNLPSSQKARKMVPTAPGDFPLNLDPALFRLRGDLNVSVVDQPLVREVEPNDSSANATPLPVPGLAVGRLAAGDKEDWFRFSARAGELLVVESAAEQLGSPLDTKLEIRDAEGRPVLRTILQAVRASAVTFRGIDSTTVDCRVENWEEMELNQLLYLQGEVVKLFRAPQGPDSGFNFYAVRGRRRNYFDTTASAHANAEPCYIVEARRPDEKIVANGLPTFPLYFENDDDADRKLGSDSKILFRAPRDGSYCVRLTDSRGFSGDLYSYALSVRPARPDFKITVDGMNPAIARGSGQRFAVNAERFDGFEGEIKVEISGLPAGVIASNPVVIQEGHTSAFGDLFVASDAPNPGSNAAPKLTASARINEAVVTHDAGTLGKITLSDSASLYVSLEPGDAKHSEITIAPGESVPAFIKVRRNGHNELITFQVENLPHGIIVDNIGLNGVLIPKDQNEREIFLTAARWVPESDRWCYAISNEAGRQTSRPILVKVRKSAGKVAAR